MNELSRESSPYLLQHACNPVHWKAWNNDSLSLSLTGNRLMIISIGYAACHWCHVMEHESFEDLEVAAVMNEHFVNIKVDREERPDIDAVYMKAVQIMSGHGGWPLNVVALPDGRPIWGGTYFRKYDWINALGQLQELFVSNPEKLEEYASRLQSGLEQLSLIPSPEKTDAAEWEFIASLIVKWEKSFDWEYGGMARAPKFMMPNNYAFLMRFAYQHNDQKLLDFVDLTLTKMAYGGIFDTIDGGFSRYSVDARWHIPHFEKMLYDNGQLVSLYADAYKRTNNGLYKEVVEKTLHFVRREWQNADGGFYCAWDADSLNGQDEMEEGAFYVWDVDQLKYLLGDDFELFRIVFNINDFGHWENESFVLIQTEDLSEISKRNGISLEQLKAKKHSWEHLLFSEREKRSHPRLDDKCLTSWNAIMLKGFVDAYKALEVTEYLDIAIKNANFIVSHCWSSEGNLWHSYKNKTATINGFLEDYAHVIDAFIALYQVTFDSKWLYDAKNLADYCLDHFFDGYQGFFNFKSDLDEVLIASHIEIEDNVIPASNSVMAKNLFNLSIYFENSHYHDLSKKMTQRIIPMIDYAGAFSNWLDSYINFEQPHTEIAICGPHALKRSRELQKHYLPHILVGATESESTLPFLKQRPQSAETQYYLCQGSTCLEPITDFKLLMKELKLD